MVLAAGVGLAEVPVAVSPGEVEMLVRVGDACPTFSWTETPGSQRYELVVYAAGEEEEQAREVLKETLPAGATAWTPSLEQCLKRGGRYAWSVRAVGADRASGWSAPSLFEVTSRPSEAELEEALEIVQRSLGRAPSDRQVETGGPSRSQVAGVISRSAAGPSATLGTPGGEVDLQVNGAPVVTTATFAEVVAIEDECPGALASGDRYTDCGNGTVRDNNTGFHWLKDASCADLAGTDSSGRANWAAAQAAAAALENGKCGLTDASVAGDWRQPKPAEFCSGWGGTFGACPASAAPDSLIDSTVGPPTVASGHPFVGVQSDIYWSRQDLGSGNVWVALLDLGFIDADSDLSIHYIWPVRVGD